MTVKMHGMRDRDRVIENQADRVVGAIVVHVPLRVIWIGCVPCIRKQEYRVVVVGTERHSVHEPQVVASRILACNDIDCGCRSWIACCGEGEERSCLLQRIIDASSIEIAVGCRIGSFASVGFVVVNSGKGQRLSGSPNTIREKGPQPYCRARCHVSFDDNVCALSNTKSNDISIIWPDRDEIVCDDFHAVTVYTDLLETIGTCVNEAETMGLARLELEFG